MEPATSKAMRRSWPRCIRVLWLATFVGGALAPKRSRFLEKNSSAARKVAEGALNRHLHSKRKGHRRTPKEVRSRAMLVTMRSRSARKTPSPDSASLLEGQAFVTTASHEHAGRASSHSVSSSNGIGETASLDEEGYAAVADAKDDEQIFGMVPDPRVGPLAYCRE